MISSTEIEGVTQMLSYSQLRHMLKEWCK